MIVINSSVPKSASSYMYILCSDFLDANAEKKNYKRYSITDVFPDAPYKNFFNPYSNKIDVDAFFSKISSAVPHKDIIQVKVHHRCTKYINELITSNKAIAVVNFRHPAESLLSLMDAYKREPNRFKAGENFTSALRAMQKNSEMFSTWVSSPAMLVYYDEFVVNPSLQLNKFSKLVNIDEDVAGIVARYEKNKALIGEFNKGILNRRYSELTPRQVAQIENSCPALMEYISGYCN